MVLYLCFVVFFNYPLVFKSIRVLTRDVRTGVYNLESIARNNVIVLKMAHQLLDELYVDDHPGQGR